MVDVERIAAKLRSRLGDPKLGIVLGSGFAGLAAILGASEHVACDAIEGIPASGVQGHGGGLSAADIGGERAWIFSGRLHTYEGLDALQAAYPVRLLAAAGAESVLLTSAAGGLLEDDRPGAFAVVTDHLNLMGDDPIRRIPPALRAPAFPDLQRVYDPRLAAAWREAAGRSGIALRDGVLAAVAGPCYETPAEVRMLRVLGADLASMSVVPEAIFASYAGLRVAAIACIANRGAGLGPADAIEHGLVLDVVGRSVAAASAFLSDGVRSMTS